MNVLRRLCVFLCLINTFISSSNNINITQFAPLLWDGVPISTEPSIKFKVDENGIETYQNNNLTIIRHENDFISHMQLFPPIPLDNYQYVMKVLNRLAQQSKRDVKSMYYIFNILYYSDFEVTKLNNKRYALSKTTKMDWIKLHLRDDLPQAPFMAYMAIMEEDRFESTAWILAALRAGYLDYLRCQDPSTASAAESLERWIDKEIFERNLLYSKGQPNGPSGVEVLLGYYNVVLSEREQKEAKIDPEKIFQQAIINQGQKSINKTLIRAYQDGYRAYVNSSRMFEARFREALIARADMHIKKYYTGDNPYWMAYHGMLAIQNPKATDSMLFKASSEELGLSSFERSDYQRSIFGEIEYAVLQNYLNTLTI